MRKYLDVIGCFLGGLAVIGQFIVMLQNRQADVTETIIRFFSYFTILTNILVALYFTSRLTFFKNTTLSKLSKNGNITAITAFILVVGLVYQFLLRGTWQPSGIQKIIDELLHSVIPLYVFLYWLKFATKTDLHSKDILIWLGYPIGYFIYIIIRGHFSGFYPYPFIHVTEIGYPQVLINAVFVTLFLLLISSTLLFIGNKTRKS